MTSQEWNRLWTASRAETVDKYRKSRTATLLTVRTALRVSLVADPDNPVASGAIVGIMDLLSERGVTPLA